MEFESILTTKNIMHTNTHPINSRRKITQPKPMQHKIISLYTQTTIVTTYLEKERFFFVFSISKQA
jgi:hypothetical protein